MDSLLNLEELAVLLSVAGAGCWVCALRTRPSLPWGESAALKRVLLVTGGMLLQVPIALVLIYRPPYVTGAYTVEPFSLQRLLLEYAILGAAVAGVAVLLGGWTDPG